MFKSLKSLIAGAGLVLGATAASAGGLPPEVLDDVMRTCRPDYHRVCSEVVPGGGRVGRCLLDHERELAPQCLKAIKLAYAVESCMPDYRRFCPGVAPGGGQIVECLADRIEQLAPECARVVSANAPYATPGRERYSSYRASPSEPYANESYRRERPYDDRYADQYAHRGYDRYREPYGDGRYPDRSYDGPGEPEEEREPIK
jgi:hypothetical protein